MSSHPAMGDKDITIYEFGAFRFDASERLLYRDSEVVPLTPKAADTLLALLAQHGRVVEKGDLLKFVWPDTFVEEGGLARNISVLRKALGDEPDGGRYIETIPKRGYRFAAAVTRRAPGEQRPEHVPEMAEACWSAGVPARPGPAGVPARTAFAESGREELSPQPPRAVPGIRNPAIRWAVGTTLLAVVVLAGIAFYFQKRADSGRFRADSIAVLPLRNVSNDQAQEYFSEGMTDLLATELARKGVHVIAPESVQALYAGMTVGEIARRLKVDAVVQGTVLGSGDRVRINAQLVDVATGRVVWGDSYERALRDVLRLQSEVAGAIASEVTATVRPSEPAAAETSRRVVPDAYHAYLKGRYFWNKRTEASLRKAIDYFNEAIAKDARYAPAHAGLADCYALLASTGYDAMSPREAMPLAKAAAQKAMELDSRLAEAHASLAYVLMAYDWDFAAAEKEFQQASALNPGYATAHQWHAHLLLAEGRLDGAAAEMAKAQELDPLSLVVNVGTGWCSYFARRYDDAINQYRKALEMAPEFPLAHQTLAIALEEKSAYGEAIAEFRKALEASGGSASAAAFLGHAYARAGRRAEAQAQLRQLSEMAAKKYVPAIYSALVYLGLNDLDAAATWLAKARDERSEYLIYYRVDPNFDAIRNDPRFTPLFPAR